MKNNYYLNQFLYFYENHLQNLLTEYPDRQSPPYTENFIFENYGMERGPN